MESELESFREKLEELITEYNLDAYCGFGCSTISEYLCSCINSLSVAYYHREDDPDAD